MIIFIFEEKFRYADQRNILIKNVALSDKQY